MPHARPHVALTEGNTQRCRTETLRALKSIYPCEYSCGPLIAIKIRDTTTPQMVAEAQHAGAVAGKVYPVGVTTNSDEGLRDFHGAGITETFRAMQDLGMPLLIHGELDQKCTLVTKREAAFLPTLFMLAERFPRLRIVLEHISTRVAVGSVLQLGDTVAATITAHHLCLTLNDVRLRHPATPRLYAHAERI